MKSNELRVGNYIRFGELIHQCKPDDIKNLYTAELKGETLESYKPLPLTKKRFIDLGFLLECNEFFVHKSDNLDCPDNNIDKYLIFEIIGNYFQCILFFNHGENSIKLNKIYYVHELQNIYYAHNKIDLFFNKK